MDSRKKYTQLRQVRQALHDQFFKADGTEASRNEARSLVNTLRNHLDSLTTSFDESDRLRAHYGQQKEQQPAEPDPWIAIGKLLFNGWTVERASLYDEDGVEGWRWTDPAGNEYTECGAWDEPPVVPDSVEPNPTTP